MTRRDASKRRPFSPALEKADVFRCTARRLACENSCFEVFFDRLETSDGTVIDDFLIVRPRVQTPEGIAGICVLAEVDDMIGLMGSYRHQMNEVVWQAPAGFMEPGESPTLAAKRELREELRLDCTADALVSLGTVLPDAGLVEARVALFVARQCFPVQGQRDHEPGTGPLTWFTRDELAQLLRSESAIGAATLIAATRYLDARKNLMRS